MKEFEVLEKGVRFSCQGSGKCCLSRGEYGYVYLTLKDRKRMALFLGLKTPQFTKQFCYKSDDGLFYLKGLDKNEACVFLQSKKCSIYEARPSQCRTWPFWPEVMNPKAWSEEVASFCPGINKGRYHSPREIKEVLANQKRSENQL